MIAIIDYGMGNIHSVQKALELAGATAIVTNRIKDIEDAQKLVLPGVGAFGDAMSELKKQGLVALIKGQIKKKKPFLGICLGMQLLFRESQEAPGVKGLGVLGGVVKKFSASKGLKVPHMGWNELEIKNKNCPLLKDIDNRSYVYFCHSYYPDPAKASVAAASCEYGRQFACVAWQDNVYGAQFHPEKSQENGLKMLKNFVRLC
ncbi:MAG: imidazole glycerol phosphate synthase subunit HisH [Candidatus Omnitrophica bacterium]|nr:imidazole glycerol phosphate synthase subunit HisH [Candidatus Omnitrophota bacterium]